MELSVGPEPAATGPLVDPLPVGNVPEKAFDGVAHVFVNDAPSGPTEGSGSGSGSGVPAVSESGSGSGDSSGPGSGSGTEVDTESVAPLIAATPEQASATSSGTRKNEIIQEICILHVFYMIVFK